MPFPPLTPDQLTEIQGDIWSKGFPKYFETYYFFTIKPSHGAELSQCLKELVKPQDPPLISTLKKVCEDQEDIAAKKKAHHDAEILKGVPEKDIKYPVFPKVNALIAFTRIGLQAIQDGLSKKLSLKLNILKDSDEAFFEGMASPTVNDILKDPVVDEWDALFKLNTKTIHGLLKIAGSSEEEVEEHLTKIKTTLKHGTVIDDVDGTSLPTKKKSRVDGWTRPNDRGKEHFGFEDGISQPRMGGIDEPEPKPNGKNAFIVNMDTDPKLLIVTKDTTAEKGARPPWMYNGSFLVFRKLEQNVGSFEALTKQWRDKNCESQEHMGAKLMGRWQSGAPLAKEEFWTQDTKDPDKAKLMNDFGYVEQSKCPVSAHIRKTNLRENFSLNEPDSRAPRTRIIRNGIPYGSDYKGNESDKHRGLLFACYQGHIEDGFQHMQAAWSSFPDFRTKGAGHDPIVGQVPQRSKGVNGDLTTSFTDKSGALQTVSFQQLVTLKGGGYFFVPSISALKGALAT